LSARRLNYCRAVIGTSLDKYIGKVVVVVVAVAVAVAAAVVTMMIMIMRKHQ
jgi:hypothetical protein